MNRKAIELGFRRWLIYNHPSKKLVAKAKLFNRNRYINHFERNFDNNMKWTNYSLVWNIDHILPISFFNLDSDLELELCYSIENLRPLKIKQNKVRGASLFESRFIFQNHAENKNVKKLLKKIEENIDYENYSFNLF